MSNTKTQKKNQGQFFFGQRHVISETRNIRSGESTYATAEVINAKTSTNLGVSRPIL